MAETAVNLEWVQESGRLNEGKPDILPELNDAERNAEKSAFAGESKLWAELPSVRLAWADEKTARDLIIRGLGFREFQDVPALLKQTLTHANDEVTAKLDLSKLGESERRAMEQAPLRISRLANPHEFTAETASALAYFQELTGVTAPSQSLLSDKRMLRDLSARELLTELTWAELGSLRRRELLPDNKALFRLMYGEIGGAPPHRVRAIVDTIGHLTHNILATDSTSRRARYFVYVPSDREAEFLGAIKGNTDLDQFGRVLTSQYVDRLLEWYRERQGDDAWKGVSGFNEIIAQYRELREQTRVQGARFDEGRASFRTLRLDTAANDEGSAEALLRDLREKPLDSESEDEAQTLKRLNLSPLPDVGWVPRLSTALAQSVYEVAQRRAADFHTLGTLIATLAGEKADNSIRFRVTPESVMPLAKPLASLVRLYGGDAHAWIEVLHHHGRGDVPNSLYAFGLSIGLLARRREPRMNFRETMAQGRTLVGLAIGLAGLNVSLAGTVLGGLAALTGHDAIVRGAPDDTSSAGEVVITEGRVVGKIRTHKVSVFPKTQLIKARLGRTDDIELDYPAMQRSLTLIDVLLRLPNARKHLLTAVSKHPASHEDLSDGIAQALIACLSDTATAIETPEPPRAADVAEDAPIFRSSYRIREILLSYRFSSDLNSDINSMLHKFIDRSNLDSISSISTIGDFIFDIPEIERKNFLRGLIARSLTPVFDEAGGKLSEQERAGLIDELTERLTGPRETARPVVGQHTAAVAGERRTAQAASHIQTDVALIPDSAPPGWPTWKHDKLPEDTPVTFIQRHYDQWLGKGLARHDIKRLDVSLYAGFYNWLRKNDLPPGFDLPTKSQALAAAPIPSWEPEKVPTEVRTWWAQRAAYDRAKRRHNDPS